MNITKEINLKADEIISRYPISIRSATMPLLHLFQEEFGHISNESIKWIADKIKIQPINVLEVVTFYPGYRQKSPGKYHFRICRTLSCAMEGSYDLLDKVCDVAKIDKKKITHSNPIAVNKAGTVSVEFAECLASCGSAPVCLLNDTLHEKLNTSKIEQLVEKVNA